MSRYQESHDDSRAKQKLDALTEQFGDFHKKLEGDAESRKDAERTRHKEVKDELVKVEKNLNAEIKRRVDANKALQAMFETHLAQLQDKLEGEIHERTSHLQNSLDALVDKVNHLEQLVVQQNEARVREIQEVGGTFLKQLHEFQTHFENEKVSRLEREAQILKRLGDEVFRLQEKLDSERVSRESSLTVLREDLEDSARARGKSDEKFQTFILEEIAALKNDLQTESSSREASEEQIVQSLNDYVTALREGLSIVSRT